MSHGSLPRGRAIDGEGDFNGRLLVRSQRCGWISAIPGDFGQGVRCGSCGGHYRELLISVRRDKFVPFKGLPGQGVTVRPSMEGINCMKLWSEA